MKGKSVLSFFIFLLSLITGSYLLLASCARMGNPDGGLYDETPPRIVRTSPKNGGINTSSNKIVLEFDEIIKLDNASGVVISPPQLEQPEVEANGRKVTVLLQDTLKPDMTYTIDFGNSISDNNEGNPFGDFAFTFSTGAEIDTFQCSGNVLDASNLEPIKDILVGLYRVDGSESFDDSTFYKRPFERISRTDGSGHFIIKGLNKDASYRIFALKDQDQDYKFSQKSEMLAFTPRTFTPSCKQDLRPDTIWHDSIHYEDIRYVPYTHFYPDDVTLLAFTEAGQDRFMLKNERTELKKFTFYFTAPHDSLPVIEGLNFNAENAFVIDASEHNDTVDYWIRDSLVYNQDTLSMLFSYYSTDTLGALVYTTDTLDMVSKVSLAKTLKQEAQKVEEWVKNYRKEHKDEIKARKKELKDMGIKDFDEDTLIVIPPMPEEFMEPKISVSSTLDPNKNVDFIFPEPLDSVNIDRIHLKTIVDSVEVPVKFVIRQLPGEILSYRLYGEWIPDSSFVLDLDTGAFVSIYGSRTEAIKRSFKIKSLDTYGTFYVKLQNADKSAVVQLLDGTDKVVRTLKSEDGKADFFFLQPGKYYMRMFYDHNGNGVWDTGSISDSLQAEEVYYFTKEIVVKAGWEYEENWNPVIVPLTQQKPMKITKQKPDKAKTIKSRNAEKLAEMARRKKK